MVSSTRRAAADAGRLGAIGFLAVAIGAQVGVGWITFVGFWLGDAGPVSALAGFSLGALLMSGVAACHAELAGMMPVSGGEIVYSHEVFGRTAAFIVGWFLLFIAVALLSFEAVSLGWMLETLFPVLKTRPLFRFLGADVTLPQLVIGQASIWGVYALNRLGLHASARTGELLTITKVAAVVGLLIGGLLLGEPSRAFQLRPGWTPGGEAVNILGILAASPFWIGGFSTIAKLAGERNSDLSMRTVGRLMVATVFISASIYMGIIVACAAAAPISFIAAAELPAAFAADAIFGGQWAGRAILVAGVAGILSIMNALLMSSSRVARAFREIGAQTGSASADPTTAQDLTLIVLAAAACSAAGRGMLAPLNDTGAMAAIICYAVMCLATLKLRITDPQRSRPYRTPGGLPMLWVILSVVVCAGVFLLGQPLFRAPGTLPIEWIIFGAWVALGALLAARPGRDGRAV